MQLLAVPQCVALHAGIPPAGAPAVALHPRAPALALRYRQQVPGGQGVFGHLGVLFEQGLGLAAGLVFVVGVLLHVHGPEALGLVDEGPLLRVVQ